MIIKYDRVVDQIGPLQAPQDRSSPDHGEDAISNAVMRAGSVLGDIAGTMKSRDNAELADARHRADQALLVEYTSKRSDLDSEWRLKESSYQGEKSLNYATDYRDAVDKFDVQYEKRVASGTGQQWFKERSSSATSSTGGAIVNASAKEYDRYNAVLHSNAQNNLATAASMDPSRAVMIAGDAAALADVNASRMKMPEAERAGYRAGFQARVVGAGIDAAIAQGDPETAEKMLDASVAYQSASGPEKRSVRDLLGQKAPEYDAKVRSYVAGKRVDTAARTIAELPTHEERMKAIATSPALHDDSERSAAEEKIHKLRNMRVSQEASEDAEPLTFLAQIQAQEAEGIPVTEEQEAQKVNAALSLSPKGRLSYVRYTERMAAAKRATNTKAAMEQVYAEREAVVRGFLETGAEPVTGNDGTVHLSMVQDKAAFLEQHLVGLPPARATALRKEAYDKLKGNPDAITSHIETAVANAKGIKKDELYLEKNKDAHRLVYATREKMNAMGLAGNLTGDDARNAVVQAMAALQPDLPYQTMTPEAQAHADAIWDREVQRNPALKEDYDHALRYRLWLRDTRPLLFQNEAYSDDIAKGLVIESNEPVRDRRPDWVKARLAADAAGGLPGVLKPFLPEKRTEGAADDRPEWMQNLMPGVGKDVVAPAPESAPAVQPEREPSSVDIIGDKEPVESFDVSELSPTEKQAVVAMAARIAEQNRVRPSPLLRPLAVPVAPGSTNTPFNQNAQTQYLYRNPFAD